MDGFITDFTPVTEKLTNITKGDIPTIAMSYIMYKIGIPALHFFSFTAIDNCRN